MNKKSKVSGMLKAFLQLPLILSILVVAMNVVVGAVNIRAGLFMSVFTILYVIISLGFYATQKGRVMEAIVGFSSDYAWVQKQLLSDMLLPYAMADENGYVLWMNKSFASAIGDAKGTRVNLKELFPDITNDMFEHKYETISVHSSYGICKYRIDIKWVSMEGSSILPESIDKPLNEQVLIAVYLFDETEILEYMQEINDEKLVAGLIYLDNYDDALESVEEVRRSLLTALIDRKISKYISGLEGIVRKTDNDKYFFAIKQKYISTLEENRFSLLEEVKTVNIGNEMAITLSIGIGLNGDSYAVDYEYARMAIDMALGRGGDQAVIKEGQKIQYFGGKSQTPEKATRVKARVKAHALREILETKDRVLIMGHKLSDIDSFGAAVGIYRIATTLNKKASIVINDISSSIRPVVDRVLESSDSAEEMILKGEQAAELVDSNTMLVVVDVNRPSITDAPQLLNMVKTIVVLDHHRQSSEIIENAVLSYVEPYASSACEMVAEILQYIADNIKIKPAEADAMYAGIVIDTHNFSNQTGVRTFEAAAFLRRNGADVTRVRKLFRDKMVDYKAKAVTIRDSEIYKEAFAISECPSDGLESPTVVGAQAANELLDIIGIKASVVFTKYNDIIYVSARSMDEVNVQVMMENMGGGGHRTIAGAQLTGISVDEAKKQIKAIIDDMIEKGDIT